MNTDIYRFKLEDLQCIAVSDGTYTYAPPTFPPPAIFLWVKSYFSHLIRAYSEAGIKRC